MEGRSSNDQGQRAEDAMMNEVATMQVDSKRGPPIDGVNGAVATAPVRKVPRILGGTSDVSPSASAAALVATVREWSPTEMVVNEAPSTDRDTQVRSLTSDTDGADVGLAIMEEANAQEMRRMRDRASALMGQRMLSGWTMRAESCEECSMPFMSLRDGPWECVMCGTMVKPAQDDQVDGQAQGERTSATVDVVSSSMEIEQQYEDEDIAENGSDDAADGDNEDDMVQVFGAAEFRAAASRVDSSSDFIGQKLLMGWALLAETCPSCSYPLLRSREGECICSACREVVTEDALRSAECGMEEGCNRDKGAADMRRAATTASTRTRTAPAAATRGRDTGTPQRQSLSAVTHTPATIPMPLSAMCLSPGGEEGGSTVPMRQPQLTSSPGVGRIGDSMTPGTNSSARIEENALNAIYKMASFVVKDTVSVPAAGESKVVGTKMEGQLDVLVTAPTLEWKTSYAEIRDKLLVFKEAPTDPDTALTGAVDLNSVVSVDNGVPAEMEEAQQQPDRKNCFHLDLNGKALVLKATSHSDKRRWMDTLKSLLPYGTVRVDAHGRLQTVDPKHTSPLNTMGGNHGDDLNSSGSGKRRRSSTGSIGVEGLTDTVDGSRSLEESQAGLPRGRSSSMLRSSSSSSEDGVRFIGAYTGRRPSLSYSNSTVVSRSNSNPSSNRRRSSSPTYEGSPVSGMVIAAEEDPSGHGTDMNSAQQALTEPTQIVDPRVAAGRAADSPVVVSVNTQEGGVSGDSLAGIGDAGSVVVGSASVPRPGSGLSNAGGVEVEEIRGADVVLKELVEEAELSGMDRAALSLMASAVVNLQRHAEGAGEGVGGNGGVGGQGGAVMGDGMVEITLRGGDSSYARDGAEEKHHQQQQQPQGQHRTPTADAHMHRAHDRADEDVEDNLDTNTLESEPPLDLNLHELRDHAAGSPAMSDGHGTGRPDLSKLESVDLARAESRLPSTRYPDLNRAAEGVARSDGAAAEQTQATPKACAACCIIS